MEKFLKYLSLIDLYSLNPSSQITFKNKQIYSTNYGKFLTILLIMTYIGCFFYFGQNMILKLNPRTIISENYVYSPDTIKLKRENFFFSFGMQMLNKEFIIDPTIFTPSVRITKRNESNLVSELSIDLKPCDSIDLPNNEDVAPYFEINSIKGMYCLQDYTNLTMEGSEDSTAFNFIKVNINPCQNTSDRVCKTPDEINEFFVKRRFYMNYITSSVDALNYKRPLNFHGNYFAAPTQRSFKANIFINMQYLHVHTDDGFLTSTSDLKRGLQKSSESSFFIGRNDNETFLELHFQLDKTIKNYERSYDKIQEVFASTQGVISFLIICFSLLVNPLVNFLFYQDLLNGYFNFDCEGGKLNFTAQDYLCICCSKNNEKKEKMSLFRTAKETIRQNLSLNKILKRIADVEKLKFLFMDKEQINGFV